METKKPAGKDAVTSKTTSTAKAAGKPGAKAPAKEPAATKTKPAPAATKPPVDPTAYPLETGVDVPPRQTAVNKYPFKSMGVDENNSFRAPVDKAIDKETATKMSRSIGSAASRYGKVAGKKFTVRVLPEKTADGAGKEPNKFFVRCWRLS